MFTSCIWRRVFLLLVPQLALLAVAKDEQQCTFAHGNIEWNLCPLFHRNSTSGHEIEVSFEKDTPPTRTRYEYSIDLTTPLKRDGTLPADLQCPEGTQVCLKVINTRPDHPSEPPRILQVVPIAVMNDLRTTHKIAKSIVGKPSPLVVTLHGGKYSNEQQKAAFYFHCDFQSSQFSHPEFMWSFNGTHSFSWTSPYCPSMQATPVPPKDMPADTDPPDEPPEEPEYADSPVLDVSPRLKAYVILYPVGLVCFLLLAVTRFSTVRRSLSRLTSRIPHLLSLRHRKTPSPFDDFTYDADDLYNGEEVPLTPSTATSFESRISHYGSTNDT